MKKCIKCGISDQEYDESGLQTSFGYYCFKCKKDINRVRDSEIQTDNSTSSNHLNNYSFLKSVLKYADIVNYVGMVVFVLIGFYRVSADFASGYFILALICAVNAGVSRIVKAINRAFVVKVSEQEV